MLLEVEGFNENLSLKALVLLEICFSGLMDLIIRFSSISFPKFQFCCASHMKKNGFGVRPFIINYQIDECIHMHKES